MRILGWSFMVFLTMGCGGEPADLDALWQSSTSRVRVPRITSTGVDGREVIHQRPHIMDAQGRYVHIKGINVSGSHKAPPTEMFPSRYPLPDDPDLRARCQNSNPMPPECVPSKDVSYIGRPFSLEDADRWYRELALLGFNSVRLITNWESIQPYAPGRCGDRGPRYSPECYDLEYLDYYDALISKAKEHGIYVLVDMHQDIFSRHIMTYYNEDPTYVANGEVLRPEPGSLDHVILSLFPPYTDWVRGHGAPKWIVETCLPEKNLDSPYWGYFRGLGGLVTENGATDIQAFTRIQRLFELLDPNGEIPAWITHVFNNLPQRPFDITETSDILPLSPWIVAGVLSLDVDRCFASLFAGDVVFPDLVVDETGTTRVRQADEDLPDLKNYMQDHYVKAYLQVVERSKNHDNVIGYDLMNEPVGAFLMLAVGGLMAQLAAPQQVQCDDDGDCDAGLACGEGLCVPAACSDIDGDGEANECPEGRACEAGLCEVDRGPLEGLVIDLLGDEAGADVFGLIEGLNLLPPDAKPETLEKWGLSHVDAGVALDLNFSFDAKYLKPFYERVGQAIQAADPAAIIWYEPASSIRYIIGPQQFWDQPLTRLEGIDQLVYAPHWYPDIYPTIGVNSPPRNFQSDEWLYRDLTENIEHHLEESPRWMGNIPVVFGEFGTYFNFNGQPNSEENGYAISGHILNAYYEAFEELNTGNMVWCFSAENDADKGEWWNHEDFSIIGPDGEARAWPAYSRTHARATSGRLVGQRFMSQYHFWDPALGIPPPERTYTLRMEARESDAATEVFVPARQYPDGFYVWVSDGEVFFDHVHRVLYWYPHIQAPGQDHTLRVEPVLEDREARGWRMFVKDDMTVLGNGDMSTIGGVLP